NPCNDGDGCTSNDHCGSGACGGTPVVCTPLDECHQAGTCSAGACSNPPQPSGTPCTRGTCDGAGTCVPTTTTSTTTTTVTSTTSTTTTTLPQLTCSSTPSSTCQASASLKGVLSIADSSSHLKDKLKWKWTSTATVDLGDFGTPTTGTDYILCLY